MNKKIICIVCPTGCHLEVTSSDVEIKVTGNKCKRGIDYGINEATNPTRQLTTTVKIKGASLKRLPVRTSSPIPKGLIFECMRLLDDIEVHAPISMADVVIPNILGTGVDIIASRSMDTRG